MKAENTSKPDLVAENERLQKRVAELEAEAVEEVEVRRRVACGISREQAKLAIKHQREFDARMAASKNVKPTRNAFRPTEQFQNRPPEGSAFDQ
jgi:hypothetical protein